jgi:hypothetical protein
LIRDHEQKEDKLISEWSRRLPTMHDDFFMAGHQHESLMEVGLKQENEIFIYMSRKYYIKMFKI